MLHFVKRKNVLDWVQSTRAGYRADARRFAMDGDPRAKEYAALADIAEAVYAQIVEGAVPLTALQRLREHATGIDANHVDRMVDALQGKYHCDTLADVRAKPEAGWVTYGGDFFWVCHGDSLNRGRVTRMANANLPRTQCDYRVAQEIADALPHRAEERLGTGQPATVG